MDYPPVTASHIRQFEPQTEWFARSPDGIHGLAHETRVIIWTNVLAAMMNGDGFAVDGEVLGWAGALHDTQRWNDWGDPQHGTRAAEFIQAHPDILPEGVPLERVAYLCRWHVPPDARAPDMTPELMVFKDADALDRWRIYDLDKSRLRTNAASSLLDGSYTLWEKTRYLRDIGTMFSDIIDEAIAREILVDE